ncbi:MAG: aminoacyl-tRNA hydrolase, partial [Planctomycetota bacterium]
GQPGAGPRLSIVRRLSGGRASNPSLVFFSRRSTLQGPATGTMTRLVIGLGNPGSEYAGTRHNVGFHVLDRLALHEGLLFQSARRLQEALPEEASPYGGSRAFRFARSFTPDALLVKPQTFMNRSGEAVKPLCDYFGLAAEDLAEHLLVVYDDLDLPPAQLRLRPHGGSGGQKGMRSIIDALGTDRFPRLRVGIGRGRTDVVRHVLEPFAANEQEEIDVAAALAGDALLDWLRTGDIERCMTEHHPRWSV